MIINFLGSIKEFFLKKTNNVEMIEQMLFESDMPSKLVVDIMDKLTKDKIEKYDEFIDYLKDEMYKIFNNGRQSRQFLQNELNIILLLGVNGVGKTTTCIKLAKLLMGSNKKILISAADTFRSAAIDQIEKMATLINADLVKGIPGADPASIVFDSISRAKKLMVDFLIIDTAGRLQTKFNLIQEILKIKKIILKEYNEKNLFSFLILDSNTGKNMISQAKKFNNEIGVDGIILTKFDSTSKAGCVLSITQELNLPIKYITYGEGLSDIMEFSAEIFIKKFLNIN